MRVKQVSKTLPVTAPHMMQQLNDDSEKIGSLLVPLLNKPIFSRLMRLLKQLEPASKDEALQLLLMK